MFIQNRNQYYQRFHSTPIGNIGKINSICMPKNVQGLLLHVQLVPLSSNCTNGVLKVDTNGKTMNAPTVLVLYILARIDD